MASIQRSDSYQRVVQEEMNSDCLTSNQMTKIADIFGLQIENLTNRQCLQTVCEHILTKTITIDQIPEDILSVIMSALSGFFREDNEAGKDGIVEAPSDEDPRKGSNIDGATKVDELEKLAKEAEALLNEFKEDFEPVDNLSASTLEEADALFRELLEKKPSDVFMESRDKESPYSARRFPRPDSSKTGMVFDSDSETSENELLREDMRGTESPDSVFSDTDYDPSVDYREFEEEHTPVDGSKDLYWNNETKAQLYKESPLAFEWLNISSYLSSKIPKAWLVIWLDSKKENSKEAGNILDTLIKYKLVSYDKENDLILFDIAKSAIIKKDHDEKDIQKNISNLLELLESIKLNLQDLKNNHLDQYKKVFPLVSKSWIEQVDALLSNEYVQNLKQKNNKLSDLEAMLKYRLSNILISKQYVTDALEQNYHLLNFIKEMDIKGIFKAKCLLTRANVFQKLKIFEDAIRYYNDALLEFNLLEKEDFIEAQINKGSIFFSLAKTFYKFNHFRNANINLKLLKELYDNNQEIKDSNFINAFENFMKEAANLKSDIMSEDLTKSSLLGTL